MAENKVKIILDVDDQGSVKISKFAGTTESTFKDLETRSGSLSRAITAVGGAIAAAFAVEKVIDFGRSCIQAYAEQEKGERLLADAMRQRGVYSQQAMERSNAMAAAIQKETVYGDELILTVQKSLTYYGAEGDMLEKLTRATVDFAAAKGIDLVQAGDLVAKSIGSSTNALSRYGVSISGAQGSTERMQSAVEAITRLFGGAARAEAQTYEGQVKQLGNAWDDAKEELGKALMPMSGPLIAALKDAAEKTGAYVKENEDMIKLGIAGAVKGIAAAFEAVAAALSAVGRAYETVRPALKWIAERDREKPLITQGRGAQANWEARQKAAAENGASMYGFSDVAQVSIVRPPAKPEPQAAPTPPSAASAGAGAGHGKTPTGKEYAPSWEYGFDTGPGWLPDTTAPSWLEQRRTQMEQALAQAAEQEQRMSRARGAAAEMAYSARMSARESGLASLFDSNPWEASSMEVDLARKEEQARFAGMAGADGRMYGGMLGKGGSLEQLRQQLEDEAGVTAEYREAEAAAYAEHTARLQELDKRSAQVKKAVEAEKKDIAINSTRTMGQSLMQLAQGQNKGFFRMGQALAIASAVMDTHRAFTGALAGPPPPPWSIPIAAAALAMGMAHVAQIRSQKYEERALGGDVLPGRSYLVGERGPELLLMGASAPRGHVISNTDLQKLSSQPASAGGVEFHLNIDQRGAVIDGAEAFNKRVIAAIEDFLADGGAFKNGGISA